MDTLSLDARLDHFKRVRDQLVTVIGRQIVGQREVVDQMLATIFIGGHCLLVGVPGLAKTMMIRCLAGAMDLGFKRIQFTPDLMPSDITGTDVIDQAPDGAGRSASCGARFRQHRAGRRDQPRAAEDPVGPAGGDAGAAGHRRPDDLRSASAVFRHRHAEPDRAGRDVPASRGAARPVPLCHPRGVPVGRGGRADPDDAGRRRAGRRAADADRRPGPARSRNRSSRFPCRAMSWPTRPSWCGRRGRAIRATPDFIRDLVEWGAGRGPAST